MTKNISLKKAFVNFNFPSRTHSIFFLLSGPPTLTNVKWVSVFQSQAMGNKVAVSIKHLAIYLLMTVINKLVFHLSKQVTRKWNTSLTRSNAVFCFKWLTLNVYYLTKMKIVQSNFFSLNGLVKFFLSNHYLLNACTKLEFALTLVLYLFYNVFQLYTNILKN